MTFSLENLQRISDRETITQKSDRPDVDHFQPMPQRCEIELSSACNLRCSYCPRHFLGDIAAFMKFGLFRKIIDELAPFPETILVLHRRGESLLNPRLPDCLKYIKGKFEVIQLATNATLLNDEISRLLIETLSFVSFSLDAPAGFDRTRAPAKYSNVEAKVNRFLELNAGHIETQVSMVRTSHTSEHDVAQFKSIWQGKVNRVRIYEEHSSDGRFGSLKRDRENRVPCAMPFYELVVFSDGKVGRCNHDWNGSPLGDVNGQTLREVWNSSLYKVLRQEHRSQKLSDMVCKNCDSWYPVAGNQMTGETYEKDA